MPTSLAGAAVHQMSHLRESLSSKHKQLSEVQASSHEAQRQVLSLRALADGLMRQSAEFSRRAGVATASGLHSEAAQLRASAADVQQRAQGAESDAVAALEAHTRLTRMLPALQQQV